MPDNKKVVVDVEVQNIDIALEKAKELEQTLERVKALIDSLSK